MTCGPFENNVEVMAKHWKKVKNVFDNANIFLGFRWTYPENVAEVGGSMTGCEHFATYDKVYQVRHKTPCFRAWRMSSSCFYLLSPPTVISALAVDDAVVEIDFFA